jgi:alkyl hydroperoxide reductase subunit F
MAKAFLDKAGVNYRSVDVGTDREAAQHMVEISGQYGVPVITVDDEIIIGFDSRKLNELFGSETESEVRDVIIIGAGPAGLTAAVYCARKILSTLIISENIGGQALASWTIENYMGYRMISGDELMKKFEEQVREQNVRLDLDRVREIRKSGDVFVINTVSDNTYRGRAVILAQGKHPRNLGVPNEEKFLGRGLSVCSTCDGPLFKGKIVGIVGGGNSALQTAIEMSRIARQVHLIVRSTLRADEEYIRHYKEITNITTHLNHVVTGLSGDSFLTGVTLQERTTGTSKELVLDGLFAEIGWVPNTDFLSGVIDMNEQNEVIIDINTHTSLPGVFACGDVTNVKSKQIIIAAGEGAKAALEAHEYVLRVGNP